MSESRLRVCCVDFHQYKEIICDIQHSRDLTKTGAKRFIVFGDEINMADMTVFHHILFNGGMWRG